ncbi:MAG: DUF1295 domain-containing protein [Thiolinea sp.]
MVVFLFALASGYAWTIISPLLMTFLLLRVSGVALLEKDISERRPAYRHYIATTPAFLPGFHGNPWQNQIRRSLDYEKIALYRRPGFI